MAIKVGPKYLAEEITIKLVDAGVVDEDKQDACINLIASEIPNIKKIDGILTNE